MDRSLSFCRRAGDPCAQILLLKLAFLQLSPGSSPDSSLKWIYLAELRSSEESCWSDDHRGMLLSLVFWSPVPGFSSFLLSPHPGGPVKCGSQDPVWKTLCRYGASPDFASLLFFGPWMMLSESLLCTVFLFCFYLFVKNAVLLYFYTQILGLQL
jgi:hypothetical protein